MPSKTRSVCIVGAGAAGLTLARALASGGWHVQILESGQRKPRGGFDDANRARIVGTPHRGVNEGRFRAWGGSTTRWGGQLWPWEPYEFEARGCPHVPGWPISYDTLARYYVSAFASLGVPSPTLDTNGARQRGVLIPQLDEEQFALKYSTWLPWRLRNLGRSVGAPLQRDPNVAVHMQTTATHLTLDGDGRARGVEARDKQGERVRFDADVIVLAGGAVENSRLLLECGMARGGTSRWLGRGFMDHLSVRVGQFHPRDPERFARMFAPVFVGPIQHTPRIVLRRDLLERECMLGCYGHWNVELPPESGLLVVREKLRALQAGSGLHLSGQDIRQMLSGVIEAARIARGIIVDRRRYFPRGGRIHLRIDTEQLPDPESRIFLTDELDANGVPRVGIDWRVSAAERRTVVRATELLAKELDERGIGDLEGLDDPFDPGRPWGELRGDSFHMMGGTRMAISPDGGVVDTDSRVFGTENVYVAGASVFPTGGMANPTLTLIALTLRLADHLSKSA